MKKWLFILLVALCVIGYRNQDVILAALGHEQSVQRPATTSVNDLLAANGERKHKAMTVQEYAELAKTDPKAYHKFIESLREPEERGSIDKLMNLLAHGKYE